MSTLVNTATLEKALNALKKVHTGIIEGKENLQRMKQDYSEAMEKTDPSDLPAIRNLGELAIRIELMPKFIGKAMEERQSLSTKLRGEIEPLWLNLEAALQNDQEAFINDHEKKISDLFGDRSREIIHHAQGFPQPYWHAGDRKQLSLLFESGDSAPDGFYYERDAAYDRRLCKIAEDLLKIAAAYQPYKKS